MAMSEAVDPCVRHEQDLGRPDSVFETRTSGSEKQLRFGVVCYGGVSLAIYMHGITTELQRLVVASTAFCDNPHGDNPFAENSTEAVYWDVLATMARDRNCPLLRVVIDVIAGTSAGGINAIVLAKALAHGLSQNSLQTLWFEKAHFARLISRSLRQIFAHGLLPPLNGLNITRWAYQALSRMNGERIEWPAGCRPHDSLVPRGHDLDLFVTTTDLTGYQRRLDLYDPKCITDLEHRHVLRFRYVNRTGNSGVDHFGRDFDRALTFAIRCTSSFPGAFAPVSIAELNEAISRSDQAEHRLFMQHCFRSYTLENADTESASFIDGGVLNNKPFDHAIQAILARHADHEVDRRLLFIEPHPAPVKVRDPRSVGWIQTLLHAAYSIPSHQPIADALLQIKRHNRQVNEIKRLIRVSEPAIDRRIRRYASEVKISLQDANQIHGLDPRRIEAWSCVIHEDAMNADGASFEAYEALRIGGVVDDLARTVCLLLDFPSESRCADHVHRILRRWGEVEGLITVSPADVADAATTAKRRLFLRRYDIAYRRRRLRFLIRFINDLYGKSVLDDGSPAPSRRHLDITKKRLYDLIEVLGGIQNGQWACPRLRESLRKLFDQAELSRLDETPVRPVADAAQPIPPIDAADTDVTGRTPDAMHPIARFISLHREALDELLGWIAKSVLTELGMFQRLQTEGMRWLQSRSELPLMVLERVFERYVGFPYWDAMIYPLTSIGRIAELDEMEVVRISPADTVLLYPLGAEERLKGINLHHFGAFLKRAHRENDYLWGRLDAVERLLAILSDVAVRQGGHRLSQKFAWRGFASVLETEAPQMSQLESVRTHQNLMRQVSAHL